MLRGGGEDEIRRGEGVEKTEKIARGKREKGESGRGREGERRVGGGGREGDERT